MRMGIGGHHRPRGLFDTWLTDRAVLHPLGKFDLDPCAAPSPRPWDTADRHISLPEDGLSIDWQGRVWLNPPYHRDLIGLWLEKMAGHANGMALIFARTETEAWQRWVWPFAAAVLFLKGRLNFCLPDGTRVSHNSGAPSALVAYSDNDVQILRSSGSPGALTEKVSMTRATSTADGGPGPNCRKGFRHMEMFAHDRSNRATISATIPPELASCVADYAERILELAQGLKSKVSGSPAQQSGEEKGDGER